MEEKKQKKEFYGLRYDTLFKNVFNEDDTLKKLLKETIGLNVTKIFLKIPN